MTKRDAYLPVRHDALNSPRYSRAEHGPAAAITPDDYVIVDEPEVNDSRRLVIEQDFPDPRLVSRDGASDPCSR